MVTSKSPLKHTQCSQPRNTKHCMQTVISRSACVYLEHKSCGFYTLHEHGTIGCEVNKHSPVGVGLVDDPDLMLHVLSFQKAMNVWHKLHHLFIAIPKRHNHCQLMGSSHLL